MTSVDSRLPAVLTGRSVLLLDFDGPICAIFAGYPASAVADRLRAALQARHAGIPDKAREENDPLQILQVVADTAPQPVARAIADELRDAEQEATASALPTPGADDVLRSARAAGYRVGIVSNNSEQAIREYLARHQIAGAVDQVSARYDGMDPRQLKPSDHLIRRALAGFGALPVLAVMVGDSANDVRAAHAAGIPCVGYANKAGKQNTLTTADADAVVDSMRLLAHALSAA